MATSTHFPHSELVCPDGCGLNNVKPELLDLLEMARDLVGHSLVLESASRCPAHNRAVGGVPGSAHLTGEAVDVLCHFGADRLALVQIFLHLGISRIGIASTFIHVDISKTLPQAVLWLYRE